MSTSPRAKRPLSRTKLLLLGLVTSVLLVLSLVAERQFQRGQTTQVLGASSETPQRCYVFFCKF